MSDLSITRRELLRCCAASLLAAASGRATDSDAELGELQLTVVDDDATWYGTFQNHNQKVVWNENGIFMTHLRRRNKAYTAQQWRLSWSRDGGKTFQTLIEATHATNPPVLETDANGVLYLARADFLDGNAYLYRLEPPSYDLPRITPIPGAAAGKYSMHLDPERELLYFFAHNGRFSVLKLDGEVVRSLRLLRSGRYASLMYPFLSLDDDGTLYASWITQQHGRYCYRAIHVMKSPDAGRTWQTLGGKPLQPPVVADDSGPTQRLSKDDELLDHSWLFGCWPRQGKLHFVYSTFPAPRNSGIWPAEQLRYVCVDAKTGEVVREQTGERLVGGRVGLNKWNGFLASRRKDPQAPLYVTAADDERIAAIWTEHGERWHEAARSRRRFSHCYSVSGCRELTPDGWVLGAFTDVPKSNDIFVRCTVYFFRLRARSPVLSSDG